MALARTWSVSLTGVTGHLVEIEADLAPGLPGLAIIGLPDTALSESRDRIRAAVLNSGEPWPPRRITLGLSPATLPKHGSGFDVGLAIAVLAAAGGLPIDGLGRAVLLGELGLDGRVRPIRGVLPAVMAAAAAGFERVVVPAANAVEAALVPGVDVWSVATLRELIRALRENRRPPEAVAVRPVSSPDLEDPGNQLDLADVVGQPSGRRAVEVAAAGGHHTFLLGDPGTGKTMLAARLPGLLPPLDPVEALEVTAVHSVAGALSADCPLLTRPPFRDPHHTASVAALVGGGTGLAKPGLASLAHGGVLFLDESRDVIYSNEVYVERWHGRGR
jgi:magnesium chelatase family protein